MQQFDVVLQDPGLELSWLGWDCLGTAPHRRGLLPPAWRTGDDSNAKATKLLVTKRDVGTILSTCHRGSAAVCANHLQVDIVKCDVRSLEQVSAALSAVPMDFPVQAVVHFATVYQADSTQAPLPAGKLRSTLWQNAADG
jgi:hypothetical protein